MAWVRNGFSTYSLLTPIVNFEVALEIKNVILTNSFIKIAHDADKMMPHEKSYVPNKLKKKETENISSKLLVD